LITPNAKPAAAKNINMFSRIFDNWKTSVLGALLMCASFAFVFWGKATLTEAGAFLGVAFALFFSKDPKAKA
jgi:fucose permease